jgi:hypothetical protein
MEKYVRTSIGFGDTMLRVCSQEMKKVTSASQFRYYKEFIVHTKDIVQSNNIHMSPKFSEHIDFLLQFGNVFRIAAKHDAFARKLLSLSTSSTCVALRFTSRGDAYLSV